MNEYSHIIGGEPTDEPRDAAEIAKRSVVVFSLIEHAMTEHDEAAERRKWLEKYQLVSQLTDGEKQYLYSDAPSVQQDIDATWLAECLCVLLWAIGYVEVLPEESEKFDTETTFNLMPGYCDVSVPEFIENARLRPISELYDMAKSIQWAHGKAISRNLGDVTEILKERHLAINWVVGYCGLSWDETTTDT
ncbi:MAG: DUF4272 domain-containing protein [Pseudomonadales bacterium]|nr:DUF4272 domain-containing protein [Pseudomonadales bacterium]